MLHAHDQFANKGKDKKHAIIAEKKSDVNLNLSLLDALGLHTHA